MLDAEVEVGRYWTVTPIDERARLGDRAPLRLLGWGPGTPVTVLANPAAGIIAVRLGGRYVIDRQGRLRLPAEIRHACRLGTGDRLLVAVHPAEAVLVAYLPRAMNRMAASYHADLTRSDMQ
ncbi:AbrB/MazE/SpoVT family DNA-binding domain-containing protein [Couchioplanes azureus]|uniref:AbrB/MazE/SpoVT family DNA-binding domain-containing protein n=1 Tax=Couchioplanes caeruleus TaxID=56438 RepID=UPI00166FB163|nr:AbrB/MazE/SpoVT family DNA-binding domain-containing protein [Couchioplanes caeruleus]GGQ72192.1 hypothetical protein GCM10010166_47610 [Couchioplanes caeruleus subsp. azureus]